MFTEVSLECATSTFRIRFLNMETELSYGTSIDIIDYRASHTIRHLKFRNKIVFLRHTNSDQNDSLPTTQHNRSLFASCEIKDACRQTVLRAGRPRGRCSSPGRVKNFLFFTSSRLALGSIQHPIQ
jgi:hypothetical protein